MTPARKQPPLALARNRAPAYLSTITAAPVTATIRGVPSEGTVNKEDGMQSPCAVNLHNPVSGSQQRRRKGSGQCSADTLVRKETSSYKPCM
jgi:mRNA-degrading endonuclease toxin of MazEF toxin-antitoxin module